MLRGCLVPAPFSPQELVAVLTGDSSYLEGGDKTSDDSGGGSRRLLLGCDPTAILAALDCAHGYAKGSAVVARLVAVLAGLRTTARTPSRCGPASSPPCVRGRAPFS